MPEIVPALEFIHLLNANGIEADYADAVRDPTGYWEKLDAGARARFLSERDAPGVPEEVASLRVMLRRGKPHAVENVVVVIDFGKGSPVSRAANRARNRIMYRAFQAAAPEDHVEAIAPPANLFTEAGASAAGRDSMMRLMDEAWGGDPYDVNRDGPLCEPILSSGVHIADEYWLDEPLSKVLILEGDDHELLYQVEEPRLTALEEALLHTLNDRVRDVLILHKDDETQKRSAMLLEQVFSLLRMYRFKTDRRTAYKLGYYFLRNYLGLARIDPIMRDAAVEDISCNGPELPVFVAHNRHQSVRTNLSFGELELNSFTMKLAQRGGKLLSIAQPLVDATLPNGSRVQAALGHEVTSRGSAFTIRKFRADPLTAVDLIKNGTHSLDTMAMLWLATEMRRSAIIMGATASGKTTTLNVMGQFIPPTVKIVSIEDTREITLQHENWLAAVTREGFSANSGDRVSMFDLLKAALRQRPEYLVVGEIRGVEGLTLFQAMSTGHTCFSTMHAGTVENAVYRLENAPINVPRVMLTSLDFFVTQGQVDIKGHPERRLMSITEINGVDPQSRNLRINEIFRWDAARDEHVPTGASQVLDKARQKGGWTRTRLDEEFLARRRVLEGLVARNERHYSQVAKAIRHFYSERAEAPSFIGGPLQPPVDAAVTGPGGPLNIPTNPLVSPNPRADKKEARSS